MLLLPLPLLTLCCCHYRCYAANAAVKIVLLLPLLALYIALCWCHWWCYAATTSVTAVILSQLKLCWCCHCHCWHYSATVSATVYTMLILSLHANADTMLLLLVPLPTLLLPLHCWHYAATVAATAGTVLILPLQTLILCCYYHSHC